MSVKFNFSDPCNPSYVSSACCCIIGIITILQIFGSQKIGSSCVLPLVDYLKFVTLFIIAYFSYVNVIKGKKYRCGTDALPMWSSICLSLMMFSFIVVGTCSKFGGGFGAIVGYIFTILGFCCTLCCVARLYDTNGPFSSEFWNPKSLFTFKM